MPDATTSPLTSAPIQPSVAPQDLSADEALKFVAQVPYENYTVPSIRGIQILAKLWKGGLSAVFYGLDPRTKREVALKVLLPAWSKPGSSMVRRFLRGAQLAVKVQSPQTVGIFDVVEEKGLSLWVMEFVHGQSANQCVRTALKLGRKGLDEPDVVEIGIAAAQGLAVLHENGILHRDIKPGHILIPYGPRHSPDASRWLFYPGAKLADLTLAKQEELSQSPEQSMVNASQQACMGTPGYMSPEQILDMRSASRRSDVFSLGATLYALLAGRPPFKDPDIMKYFLAVIHQAPVPLRKIRPEISPALETLIDRCLDKDPENRPADGAALLNELQICMATLVMDKNVKPTTRAGPRA